MQPFKTWVIFKPLWQDQSDQSKRTRLNGANKCKSTSRCWIQNRLTCWQMPGQTYAREIPIDHRDIMRPRTMTIRNETRPEHNDAKLIPCECQPTNQPELDNSISLLAVLQIIQLAQLFKNWARFTPLRLAIPIVQCHEFNKNVRKLKNQQFPEIANQNLKMYVF